MNVFIRVNTGGTVLYHEFARECGAPGVLQEANQDLAIMPSGASHSDMAAKAHVPLLVRSWDQGLQPAEKYGYRICRHRSAAAQSESGVDYTLPAGLGGRAYAPHAYAPWVDRMTARVWAELQKRAALNAREDALVVCLHVRRGDKLSYTKYPNLNYETSPEGILKTIEPHVPHGSVLYLATNEPDPVAYFEPLRKHYDVVSLAHFARLLSTDLYLLSSLGLVDYEILGKCQRTIPTFASEDAKGFKQHVSLSTSSKQR
ncbi:hypothetical protein JKP88DRAFT_294309 [Tribonema minus]|uniref:Uncharacterized protein n=1 Tax=Tribonema minus TaxID=303371 RepID=A0A835ZJK4_9STRA|nr:hypothetical protein JKP88DRAFT_294309 [Tribonema minus]